MNKIILTGIAVFLFLQCIGQGKNIVPLKTTKISIFKNGTYFNTTEGSASSTEKVFYFPPPLTALNGTFWYTLKEAKVQSINVKQYPATVTKQAKSISEFIRSNISNEVTVIIAYSQTSFPLKGTIIAYYPETVTLKLNDGNLRIIPANFIVDISLAPGFKNTYTEDSSIRLGKVLLDKEISNARFTTLSVQTGISWVPSYLLKLNDSKKANLEIKATIENNAENIIDVPVSLVVGNPQMFYGKQLDMISGGRANVYSGYDNYAQKANSYSNYDEGGSNERTNTEDNATGEKSNDLYYYNLGNLNLEKEAKTIVKLSNNDLDYKDLYELDIEDKSNYWQTKVASIDPNTIYETWHVLKFDNKTSAPFSTGSVFVIDENGKPLAQDEVKYTPVGATTKIKLSKAIDVQTCDDEELVSKEESKTKINKRDYEVVKIKGKIKIVNYQSKQITISVGKTINGKVTNSNQGIITVLPNRNSNYMNVNDISIIKWEKEIKPNETLLLEYEYEVLVFLN